jgi:hypothetical protein
MPRDDQIHVVFVEQFLQSIDELAVGRIILIRNAIFMLGKEIQFVNTLNFFIVSKTVKKGFVSQT